MVTDELRRYVTENLDLGHHQDDITQALIDQGWSELDINHVFDEFFPPQTEEPSSLFQFATTHKTFLLLVLGGLAIALVSAVFWVYVIMPSSNNESKTTAPTTNNTSSETEEVGREYDPASPKKFSNDTMLGNAETPIELSTQSPSIDELVTFYKSFDLPGEFENLEKLAEIMIPYGGNRCKNINSSNSNPQYYVIDDEQVLQNFFPAALFGLTCVGMNNSAGDVALFYISPEYVEQLTATEFDANEIWDLGEPTFGFSIQFPQLSSKVTVGTAFIPREDPGNFVIIKQEEPDAIALTPFSTLDSGGGHAFRLTASRLYDYKFKFFVSDSELFRY